MKDAQTPIAFPGRNGITKDSLVSGARRSLIPRKCAVLAWQSRLQHLASGETYANVPLPANAASCKAIPERDASLGEGTEKMDIDFAEANESMDMPAHVKTYRHFISFMKFGIVFVAIILIGMAIFLT
jgi:hypothetical protein